jgi:probable addiction module antidote protein
MPRKSRPHSEARLERLANPEVAAEYLKVAMEESNEDFLKALKTVAQARQMAQVAKDAGVQRETLYRSLSEQGNPTWDTLRGIFDAIGLKLVPAPKESSDAEPIGRSGIRNFINSISTAMRGTEEYEAGNVNRTMSAWYSLGSTHRPNTAIPASPIGSMGNILVPPIHPQIGNPSIPPSPQVSHYLEEACV